MKTKFLIRTATLDDALSIAHVHVDAWREAYAGIVAADYLAQLSYEDRQRNAVRALAQEKLRAFVAVASDTDRVIGFAYSGPSREKNVAAEGEVFAIYLLGKYHGHGIGRALFEAATSALKNEGYESYFVSVLSENTKSVAFYEKMGGKHLPKDHVDIAGARYPTDTLIWNFQ